MFGSPFSVKAQLVAAVKRPTFTVDGNIFAPDTNKVSHIGLIRQKKIWFV